MTGTVNWLRHSPHLDKDQWKHGWSTNEGPDFKSPPDSADHAASVEKLVQAVGLPAGAWVRQVHGGTVLRVTGAGFAGEADAIWTDRPGLGVIGRGADCPLILVGGRGPSGKSAWGFAHASWRSTLQGITAGLILAMTETDVEPGNMSAVICPSAGPCCYEVGEEVRTRALESLGPGAAWFFLERNQGITFDLWAANVAQLTAAGLAESNIHRVNRCTICGGDSYPSYRREGDKAGRFAAVIGS